MFVFEEPIIVTSRWYYRIECKTVPGVVRRSSGMNISVHISVDERERVDKFSKDTLKSKSELMRLGIEAVRRYPDILDEE